MRVNEEGERTWKEAISFKLNRKTFAAAGEKNKNHFKEDK
jgi:hypothetical protein